MIGICAYFGYEIPMDERCKMMKESGIDCVIANADPRFNRQNGTFKKQLKLFKKYGLKVSSLHMRYKSENLPYFWKKGFKGFKIYCTMKKDLKLASKYGFNSVVAHFAGEYSLVGEKRLKKLLEYAKKVNVPIASENIEWQNLFVKIFDNIKSDYLKFCYDSGHNNVFDPDFDYLTKYGDKLVALHLHDNMGKHDDHTVNVYGTIDWDNIAKKLAKLPPINLDYELLMVYKGDYDAKMTLESCVKQGKELQFQIDKYRKEILNNVKIEIK